MKVADLFAKLGLRTDKKQFSSGDRLLGGIKKALVGIVAFKTVKWFGSLIRDTAQAADNFAKMSKKVGISIEALQQFEFAAGISGTNIEVFRKGLQRLARNASDAQRGLKTAQDALGDVGIKINENTKELPVLDELLMQIADRFAGMDNVTKKAALAQELFGRAGAELIPLLNEGSAGIGKLREEFVELGAQIDTETAKSFEELNDDTLRVQTALKGIRNQVVIALLPVLKEMTKSTLAWVKANRALIRQKLKAVLSSLVQALRFFAKAVAFAIEHWKPLLALLIGAKVLATLAKLIVLFKLLGLIGVKSGLATAAAWIAAALPFLILAALVTAAIALILDFFDVFDEGDGIAENLRQAFIDAFVGWIDTAVRNWKVFFSWIKDQIRKFVEGDLEALRASDTAVGRVLRQRQAREQAAERISEIGRGEPTGRSPERIFQAGLAGATGSTVNAETTINISGAGDPQETGKAVEKAMGNFFQGQMRKAASAMGQ